MWVPHVIARCKVLLPWKHLKLHKFGWVLKLHTYVAMGTHARYVTTRMVSIT